MLDDNDLMADEFNSPDPLPVASPADVAVEDTPDVALDQSEPAEEIATAATDEVAPETETPETDTQEEQFDERTWRGKFFIQRDKELKPLQAETESLRAQLKAYTDEFVGLKIDTAADKWDATGQLKDLPPNHKAKLVDAVFAENIGARTNAILAQPEAHPQEFTHLQKAAATIAEAAYKRSIHEVDQIMDMLAGVPVRSLYQLLNGQGAQGTDTGYQQPVMQSNQSQPLSQVLLANNWPLESIEMQAALQQERREATILAQNAAYAERIGSVESRLTDWDKQQRETAQQRTVGEYETMATAAKTGALESVTKGRVPDEQLADVRETIDARAERIIAKDDKTQTAYALALEFARDGMTAKAKGQMGVYAARVSDAYTTAAKAILSNYVVPKAQATRQADKAKAARKELAPSGRSAPAGVSPSTLLNGKIGRDDNVGDLAAQLYREMMASQQ